MSTTYSVSYRKSCDENHCFFIQDFMPGDSLIVKIGEDSREKGVVEFVDDRSMKVGYMNTEGEIKTAVLNDIVMLQGPVKGWLDN